MILYLLVSIRRYLLLAHKLGMPGQVRCLGQLLVIFVAVPRDSSLALGGIHHVDLLSRFAVLFCWASSQVILPRLLLIKDGFYDGIVLLRLDRLEASSLSAPIARPGELLGRGVAPFDVKSFRSGHRNRARTLRLGPLRGTSLLAWRRMQEARGCRVAPGGITVHRGSLELYCAPMGPPLEHLDFTLFVDCLH